LRGTASFDVLSVKVGARVSAVAVFKTPKIAESLCPDGREITHAQKRNPRTDLDEILRGGRYPPDIITCTNFGDHRLRDFWVAGVKFSPFALDFRRRPYNTL